MTDRRWWVALGVCAAVFVLAVSYIGHTARQVLSELAPDTVHVIQVDTFLVVPINDSLAVACPKMLDRPDRACGRRTVIFP